MNNYELITSFMNRQINFLQVEKNNSVGKGMLARLRRGVGKVPGEVPELWGIFLNELPEELQSTNGNPTNAEWAIYTSLTLFALHQQGSTNSVHIDGVSLGSAVAKLIGDKGDNDERSRVLTRFSPIITAKDMQELAHYLRSMIQLLKSNDICLDYIKLANDIYKFQDLNSRKKVQLTWGQDFYKNNFNSKGAN